MGIYKDQKLLFHGPQHEQSRLFHIDIRYLINPPEDLTIDDREDPSQEDPSAKPSIAKKGRPNYVASSRTISQRAFVTEIGKTLIATLLDAHKEEAPPSLSSRRPSPPACAPRSMNPA